MKTTKTTIVAALSALLAVSLLSGCGTAATKSDKAPVGTNASTESASADPSAGSTDEPTADESNSSDNTTAAFGQTYTWDDGIAVTISKPQPYKASQYGGMGGEKFKNKVAFTVILVNGTDKPFDASMANSTIQSNDAEGDEIFDTDAGYGGSPSTRLLPGRQAKWKIAYGVANPADLVLQFTADYDHDAVIYTNAAQ